MKVYALSQIIKDKMLAGNDEVVRFLKTFQAGPRPSNEGHFWFYSTITVFVLIQIKTSLSIVSIYENSIEVFNNLNAPKGDIMNGWYYSTNIRSDNFIELEDALNISRNEPCQLFIITFDHQSHSVSQFIETTFHTSRPQVTLNRLNPTVVVKLYLVLRLSRSQYSYIPYLEQLLQVFLIQVLKIVYHSCYRWSTLNLSYPTSYYSQYCSNSSEFKVKVTSKFSTSNLKKRLVISTSIDLFLSWYSGSIIGYSSSGAISSV